MTVQYNSNYDLTLPFSDSSAQPDATAYVGISLRKLP